MSLTTAAGRARRIALFLCAFVVAPFLHALDVPPPPTQWFTDQAGVVGPTEADLLNRKLSDFEQQSGAQFIIYVFRSLESEAIEDFTIRCVERWKVGQKKYDNGLVLFVFVEDRKVRIEVGYGLEGTITDAFSSRVIRDQIAPAFQRQQYAEGLNAAADAIITKIRTGEEPVPPMQRRGDRQQARDGKRDIGIVPLIFILIVIFFVVVPMLRRGGGCGGCLLPLLFSGGGVTFRGGGHGGGFGGGGGFSGGFGGGGFSGGGGGFGGGGATGGW